MRHWVNRVRALDEHRRKRIFIWSVVVVFCVLLGGWIIAIQLGFVDTQASWMSGTHTYSASGTPQSTDFSPLRDKWNQAKDAVGNAWNSLGSVLEGNPTPIVSSTPSLLPASSTPQTASSTTSSTNTSL